LKNIAALRQQKRERGIFATKPQLSKKLLPITFSRLISVLCLGYAIFVFILSNLSIEILVLLSFYIR
jgi:hypothetical protein